MRQKPKICQGCKFYLDFPFAIKDYTPYFSIADRGKVETLLKAGDCGRCSKHSQMFPETEFQEDQPVKGLIIVSSAVSVCVVVRWSWSCADWKDKEPEKKIEWGEQKDKKLPIVMAVSS